MDFVSVSVHFAACGRACVIVKTDKELREKLLQVPMFTGGGSPLEACCIYLAAVVLRPSTGFLHDKSACRHYCNCIPALAF